VSARLTPRRRAARSFLNNNALSGTIPALLGSLTDLYDLCGRVRGARRERVPHAAPPRRSQPSQQQRAVRLHPGVAEHPDQPAVFVRPRALCSSQARASRRAAAPLAAISTTTC